MKVDAIVLGGGSASAVGAGDFTVKSMITVCGKPLGAYVAEGLRAAAAVERIALVAPLQESEIPWRDAVDLYVESDGPLTHNVANGINALGSDKPVLVCSSDMPLLTGEAVDDFIIRCEESGGEFCYPIIAKDLVLAAYPQTTRTYATLHEGTFTGGNMGLIYPEVFKKNRELFEAAYSARKSPLKLFRMLGLWFIIKLLLKKLTISEAEAQCTKMLGAKARTIITPFPQIGIDVDKPEDLLLVEGVL